LAHAEASTTVAELKAMCAQPEPVVSPSAKSVVTRREQEEIEGYGKRYVLTPHRLNYLLPASYSQLRPSSASYSRDVTEDANHAQKIEAKFQLSFKFPLLLDAFGGAGDLMAGYTQRSFWQMYNSAASRPFRETNYEPELWYAYPVNTSWQGWNVASASIGFNHQSNGRGEAFSRSWNRVISSVVLERGEFAVALRPWLRLRENSNSNDNPDLSHYMGRFDLLGGRKFGNHSLDVMLRNNLRTQENRGAFQLGWSFPLPRTPRLRGYVQWFNGYGESLSDYRLRQNTLGLGVQMADW
jgi:phospholipase A1/A2